MSMIGWETPSASDNEIKAKEWLNRFLMPHYEKYESGSDIWLSCREITVRWKNEKRYICTGASRLDDVWIKRRGSENFYDHRVDVNELSNWKCLIIKAPESPQ